MTLYLNYEARDYNKDIFPFMRKIFLDTSVMKIFIDGFTKKKFSKKNDYDYKNLINLFERLKLKNNFEEKDDYLSKGILWNKFWITPQIFVEICQHFCQDKQEGKKRNKRGDFNQMVCDLIPIFKEIKEEVKIGKEKVINLIDENKPVIELGDFSIFIAVDEITERKEKLCVIARDEGIKERFENYPNVLMIDYDLAIWNMD